MSADKQQTIATLLARAGSAHGVYEEGELGGVYDQNWPEWYAGWLLEHGLNDLVPAPFDRAGLARFLKECDLAYKRDRPNEGWPSYYARLMLSA